MSKSKNDSIASDPRYLSYIFRDERFIDLNIYQFGWEKCIPLHQFGPAIRNHFLFHYVISGKGRLWSTDHEIFVHGGQGFILYPNQISTYFADEEDPWEYVWLEFDGLRANESITLSGMSKDSPVYTPVSEEAGAEICRLMKYIVDHPTDPPMRLISYAMLLLVELVQSSSKRINTGNKRLRDFYLRQAIDYVNANYQNDITIEDIAEASGLNRNYFGRLFKEAMGETPQQFLLHYLMSKAAELLRGSQMTIKDIGISVGYENQLHFSRAFKGIFGTAPSEYRRNHFHL